MAAGGKGVEVGRVSVRVAPDTSGFRKQLEKDLKGSTKQLTIPVGVDTTGIREEIDRAVRDTKVTADVDADTTAAEARLLALDDKTVKVKVDYDDGGLLTKLRNLDKDGLKPVSTAASAFMKTVGSLSKTVGSMASVFGGLSAAAAGAGGALQLITGLVSFLGSALSGLSGLAGLAVGGLAGLVTLGATLKVGFSGVGDAIKLAFSEDDPKKFAKALEKLPPEAQKIALALQQIKPMWQDLQKTVQQKLFAGVTQEVQSLATTYIPVLKTGMTGVATEVNTVIKNFAQFAQQKQTIADLGSVFTSTGTIVRNLGTAMTPLLEAFRDIGTVGAQVFAELTGGAGTAAQKFADFVAKARETGQLKQWIEGGVQAFRDLWNIVSTLGQILGAVFKPLLGDLNVTTGSVRALAQEFLNFVKTDSVQQSLTSLGEVLRGAFKSAVDTARVAFETLGPVLQQAAPLMAAIGQSIHTGLVTAFQILGPILTVVVGAMSAMSPVLAPLIGLAIAGGAAFKILHLALLPLTLVGQLLVGSFNLIKGAINLASVVATTTAQVAAIVAQWVAMAAAATLNALKVAAQWVIMTGAAAASAVATMVSTATAFVAQWVLMGAQALIQAARVAAAWLIAMGPIGLLIAAVVAVVALIVANWDTIVSATQTAWNAVSSAISTAWDAVVSFISSGLSSIGAFFTSTWTAITSTISSAWTTITTAVSTGITSVVTFISELPGKAVAALVDFAKQMADVGTNAIKSLATAISNGASAVIQAAINVAKAAIQAVKSALGIASPSKVFTAIGKFLGLGWMGGIRKIGPKVIGAVVNLGNGIIKAGVRIGDSFGKWNWDKHLHSIKLSFDKVIYTVQTKVGEITDSLGGDLGSELARSIESGVPNAIRSMDKIFEATRVHQEATVSWQGHLDSDGRQDIGSQIADALAGWGVDIDQNGIAKLVNKANNTKRRRR